LVELPGMAKDWCYHEVGTVGRSVHSICSSSKLETEIGRQGEVVMDDAIIMPREHAQAYALTFPGAYAEHPWGQTVIKVKRKVFLFVNGAIAPEAGVSLSVKLPQSGADVLQLPLAEPMGYGMGKHGWVTLLIMHDDQLPPRLLDAWIDESYRAVAPKRLLAELDELRQPHRTRHEQLP
jgi:predicted DNA-binding protein (MmcQ/YjbR family)